MKYEDVIYANGLSHDESSTIPFSLPLKLDIYKPENNSENRPVFMWIHGGGFTGGIKHNPDIVEMANYYASRGWVFISIDYRTTEELGNTQGMNEEDAKKSRKNFEEIAKKRIKTGLILNEFGEQNQIKVNEQEIQAEIQKQLRMMPGQEKFLMEYYQKNPSAVASLRGNIYEEKIIEAIKSKAKISNKSISKEEAEKILKAENEKNMMVDDFKTKYENKDDETSSNKKQIKKKTKTVNKKSTKTKKVSKK